MSSLLFLNVFSSSFLFIKIFKSYTPWAVCKRLATNQRPTRMKTWNKFCVSAACSFSSFRSDSGSAVRRRRRIPDETASSFSIVSRSDLFIRYYRPNSIESSCNATSSVPNIGDAKIVVTFRVETSIRAQKTSNWNNPCFCPCAQDLKSVRKKILTQK